MAPRQSLSRGTAKKVVKNFASKAVKNVLDNLIESKIRATPQNQKTVRRLIYFYRHISALSVVKRPYWLDPPTALEVDIENEVKCTKEGLGGIKSCIHPKRYFFFTAIYWNFPQMRSRCESLFYFRDVDWKLASWNRSYEDENSTASEFHKTQSNSRDEGVGSRQDGDVSFGHQISSKIVLKISKYRAFCDTYFVTVMDRFLSMVDLMPKQKK